MSRPIPLRRWLDPRRLSRLFHRRPRKNMEAPWRLEQLEDRCLPAGYIPTQADISVMQYETALLLGEAMDEHDPNSNKPINPAVAFTYTGKWIVGMFSTEGVEALAQQLGASTISVAPLLENGWSLGFDSSRSFSEIAAGLATALSAQTVSYYYPLLSRELALAYVPNDTLYTNQWHHRNPSGYDANLQPAWDITKGSGQVIAIVDTGTEYDHPDLAANLWTNPDEIAGNGVDDDGNGLIDDIRGWDFSHDDNDPYDNNPTSHSHGTATTGLAAAVGDNALGVAGTAYLARYVPINIFDGTVTDSEMGKTLSYKNQRVTVWNNSWGYRMNPPSLVGAGAQTAAGIIDTVTNGRGGRGGVIVFSAGNDASIQARTTHSWTTNNRRMITVGALQRTGVISSYSTPGPGVLISSPGGPVPGDIWTTDRKGANGYASGDYTGTFNGTSAAAPILSGIVANILAANTSLTYRDVQHILVQTAVHTDSAHSSWKTNAANRKFSDFYGFGAVNAGAAVTAAQTWTNVAAEQSVTGSRTVNASIPDNNSVGVTDTISLQNLLRTEWVEVTLNALHTYRGDLEITLTSPSGTKSVLAMLRNDSGDNYSNWVFSTNQFWGEHTAGDWKLTIRDLAAGDVGTWTNWTIRAYGTPLSNPVINSGAGNNNITVRLDSGGNVEVVIDGNTVLDTPRSNLTELTINGEAGNDTLTVNYGANGFFDLPITFNGGDPTSGPGDKLIVTGGTFTTVTHNFANGNSGNIVYNTGSKQAKISYTGLEPIDDSGNKAGDIIFNLPDAGVDSDAFLEDAIIAGDGLSQLRSANATFELTVFSNPTNSLTINRGRAGDDLTIAKLPDFNRTLVVGESSKRFDKVAVTGAVDLAADFNLSIHATTIDFPNTTSDVKLLGAGKATLDSSRATSFATGSSLATVNGDLSVTANASAGTGNFIGVMLSSATLETTGSGNIAIAGTGGSDAATEDHRGVDIFGTSLVAASGTGKITIAGTGGAGVRFNSGVQISQAGSSVTTNGGEISITGVGKGSGSHNTGVQIRLGALVSAGGSGKVTLNGTGANGTNNNIGVLVEQSSAKIATGSGDLAIIGVGQGTTTENSGIVLGSTSIVSSTSGKIALDGTAAAGSSNNEGVQIRDSAQVAASANNVTITGKGGGAKFGNIGVHIFNGASVSASGIGTLTITGTAAAGENDNYGVSIREANTKVVSSGNLTITGTGNGSTTHNFGVFIHNSALVATTGNGSVSVVGTGGSGTNNNDGVRISGSAEVTASVAAVSITGAGKGAGTDNIGILITGGVVSTTGLGQTTSTVTLHGTGAAGTSRNYGVLVTQSGGKVTTVEGNISITGNGQGSADSNYGVAIDGVVSAGGPGAVTILGTGGAGTTTNYGVLILGAGREVRSVNGDINITGKGQGSGSQSTGVLIFSSALVTSAAGKIILDGTSGSGAAAGEADGVNISDKAQVTAAGNSISITGKSLGGAANNVGIHIASDAVVSTTGSGGQAGALTLNGTGGAGSSDNHGVSIKSANTLVSTAGGAISITGTALGTGSTNVGVNVAGGKVSAGGSGTLTVAGTGGPGTNSNVGIQVSGVGAAVQSAGGNLQFTGTSGGTGATNHGVVVALGAVVSAGGAGKVTFTGTSGNGTDNNYGVLIHATSTQVTTAGGFLTITGTGRGSAGFNHGVGIFNDAVVSTAKGGFLSINGAGGSGGAQNHGVLINGGASVKTVDGFIDVRGSTNSTVAMGSFGIELLAGVHSTGNGNIALIADSMDIGAGGAVVADANVVEIRRITSTQQLNLGGADAAGVLGLTDAELDRIVAGHLWFNGVGNTGLVTVSGNIDRAASTLIQLTSGDGIAFAGGSLNSNGNWVILSAASPGITTDASGVDVIGTVLDITVGAGGVGSLAAPLRTSVTHLTVSASSGNGDQFYHEADSLTIFGGLSANSGVVTFMNGKFDWFSNDRVNDATSLAVTGGAALDLKNFTDTVQGAALIDGAITGTTGLLTSKSNFDLRSGSVSLALGGNIGAVKSTGGTVTFAGSTANQYTGTTTVNDGVLILSKTGGITAIPGELVIGDGSGAAGSARVRLATGNAIADSSDLTLAADGQLDLFGNAETVDGLSGSGVVTNSAAGTATLTVGANHQTGGTFGGVVENGIGTVAFTKTGTGTLTLGGGNTYTGATTINGGTLLVTGSLAAGSAVSVNSGGTLGGTGVVHGSVGVSAGGAVSPGVLAGTLRTGSAAFVASSQLRIDINGKSAGQFDLLDATGSIDLGGSTLVLSGSYVPVPGDSFTIAQASTTVTGTFAGLPHGSTVFFNGSPLEITYSGTTVSLAYDSTPVIRGGDSNNDIEVRKDAGGNIEVVVDGVTVLDVAESDLTSLTVEGEGGDDFFTLNYGFAGGFFSLPITLHGGGNNDSIAVVGGSFASLGNVFADTLGTGKLEFNTGSKTSVVQFTTMEPLYFTGATTKALNFVLPNLADTAAMLEDSGAPGDGVTQLRSAGGRFAVARFGVSADAVEIFSNNGNDALLISDLPDFDRSVSAGRTAATGKTFAKVAVAGAIALAADRNFVLEAERVQFDGTANVKLAGAGTASVLAGTQFVMKAGAALATIDGDIYVDANAAAATGNFAGLDLDGAMIQTAGSGEINLTGRGGLGVRLHNAARILALGDGLIRVHGYRTDGAGSAQSHGIAIVGAGSRVASVDGDITMLGDNENSGGGDSGIGLVVDNGAVVEATGMGDVTLQGVGRGSIGVDIVGAGSAVRSKDGKIYLLGTGEGDAQAGVTVLGGAMIEASGLGDILLDGLGADGVDHNHGIVVDGKSTRVTSAQGGIELLGTGRGSGAFNLGISIQGGARLIAGGSGTATLTAQSSSTSTPVLRIVGDDGSGTNSGITAGAGTVTLAADEIDLGAAESITGAGAIVLRSTDPGRRYDFGGSGNTPGRLTLTTGDLAAIDQTSAFTSITFGVGNATGKFETRSDVALAVDTVFQNTGPGSAGIHVGHLVDAAASKVVLVSAGDLTSSGGGRVRAGTLNLATADGAIGASAASPFKIEVGTLNASAKTGLFISEADGLSLSQIASESNVDIRTSKGDIQFSIGSKVTASSGVVLHANDNLNAATGVAIAGTTIDLAGGQGGKGGKVTLFATFTTAKTITVSGGAGADTFWMNGNSSAYAVDGKAGSDTIDFSTIASPVDIDVTGPGSIDGHQGKINLAPVSTFDNINAFVNITAPVADAGGPYVIHEGDSLQLDGSKSTSSTGLPLNYAWELDGDDDFDDAFGVAPTISWAQLQGFGIDDGIPPGSKFTVRLRVSDNLAPSDDDDAPLTLHNTASTGVFAQDASPRIERRPTTVRFTSSFDHSNADAAAGWLYSFDFNNDGDFADPGDVLDSKSASAQFTFPFEGNYAVRGRIKDKDGGFTDYVITVVVHNVDLIVLGGDKNLPPRVRALDAASNEERFNFLAFDSKFKGGVRVAAADVNNDGIPEIIATMGAGAATRVRVFDGVTGQKTHEFAPFAAGYKGGAFVAAGDVNGDGFYDIVVATDAGSAGQVRVFDGKQLAQDNKVVERFNLAPYPASFKGGVRVAAADYDGDGIADVVTVPGSGRAAEVRVFSGANQSAIGTWTAFLAKTAYKGGVFVAAGDIDGDGKAEITVSQGASSTPRLQAYRGGDGKLLADWQPFAGFNPGPAGIRVAMQDRDGDGKMDIIVAPGPGVSRTRIYKGNLFSLLDEFEPFGPAFKGGIFVG